MKKIEIIIESIHMDSTLKFLQALGLPGYTIISDVSGRGAHGVHDCKDLSNVAHNSYLIIICSQEKALPLLEKMREKIKKYGGLCFVSTVEQLEI